MSIHKHLPPQARKELKEVGWTMGLELAKVARRDGQEFDCATWLHKARAMPKDPFRREVEKQRTGTETEASELAYFKLYESQGPGIEQAIETAAFMLGADKSCGYCLEISARWLALSIPWHDVKLWKSTIAGFEAKQVPITEPNLITLCADCQGAIHRRRQGF